MATPKVYVICDQNCKFEGMTKEQILTAIVQAVNEGTIGDIDTGFIQTIKTINGLPLRFFVGEQSAYDALSEEQKKNLFAIITNDTTKEGIFAAIDEIRQKAEGCERGVFEAQKDIIALEARVKACEEKEPQGGGDADHAATADHATEADHATTADSATNAAHAATADHATNADSAARAAYADSANEAVHALGAETAGKAPEADHATTADNATKATNDANGNTLYGRKTLWSGSTAVTSSLVNISLKTADLLNRFIVFEFELVCNGCVFIQRTSPVKVTTISTGHNGETYYFEIGGSFKGITLKSDKTSTGGTNYSVRILIPRTTTKNIEMACSLEGDDSVTLKAVYEEF